MEPPRRMLRTNRFKANRNGKKEEEKKVVKPEIVFKVSPNYVPPTPTPTVTYRPRRVRYRRPPFRAGYYQRMRNRRRVRNAKRGIYMKQAAMRAEEIAERFEGNNGFPCGLRKSGKSLIGKKSKAPQRHRRPWKVKLAQSSQTKKRKHKKDWKRRGQDIDFGY